MDDRHFFLAYPKGHAFTSSCLRCGRRRENPIHHQPPKLTVIEGGGGQAPPPKPTNPYVYGSSSSTSAGLPWDTPPRPEWVPTPELAEEALRRLGFFDGGDVNDFGLDDPSGA